MIQDRIQAIGNSRIQYGPLSDRVYLMHLGDGEARTAIDAMQSLAREEGYTKLFAKIPAKSAAPFKDAGFETEARIPAFYADGDAALFMSRFRNDERRRPSQTKRIQNVLATASERAGAGIERPLPDDHKLTLLTQDHAVQMATLYGRVFDSYPFPIFDADYIRQTMKENFRYFGVFCGAKLVALASAERNEAGAEMTDFATHPDYRRASLAAHILAAMEDDARQHGVKTAFTIARALSYGINILFARGGYTFAGTLVNNTHISGGVQSMNIWYKPLADSGGAD